MGIFCRWQSSVRLATNFGRCRIHAFNSFRTMQPTSGDVLHGNGKFVKGNKAEGCQFCCRNWKVCKRILNTINSLFCGIENWWIYLFFIYIHFNCIKINKTIYYYYYYYFCWGLERWFCEIGMANTRVNKVSVNHHRYTHKK